MKRLTLLVLMVFTMQLAFSQTDVVQFLKGGKADASKLVQAYLEPYAFALGDGLNNGWCSSAASHKLFGFDLTVSLSGIQIPESALSFDISKLNLSNMVVESGGNIAPTIAGKDVAGPKILVKDNEGNSIATFNTPNGLAMDLVPVPMAQVGFGLLPYTDVIGRYVPEKTYSYNNDQMKLGFWGVGVKHNFLKWIPVLKQLPLDASIFASYSEVNAQSELSFTPEDYGVDNVSITFTNNEGQFLKVKTNTSKFGLIVSKKLSIITVFAGIAQSTSESTIDLVGKYPVLTKVDNGGYEITNESALIDPIALKFKNHNISMDAGLRVKLAFLSIFGSISKSEYTSYNAGLSLSVR
ncbi:MAG: DUF6588 family protein [Prolixibacteraceae bacterium]